MDIRSRRPRIKSRYSVRPVDPDLVFFLSDTEAAALKGPLFQRLAAELDGSRTLSETFEALSGRFSRLDVEYGLKVLADRGLLTESDPGEPASRRSVRERFDLTPEAFRQRLDAARVAVVASGGAGVEALRSSLGELGMSIDEEADFAIVAVDDYLSPDLRDFNRDALDRGRSWMPVQASGPAVWLGPVFGPARGPCWQCLADSLLANRPVLAFYRRCPDPLADDGSARPHAPPGEWAAASLAAAQALKWSLGLPAAVAGRLLTFDVFAPKLEEHPVRRNPRCPACGGKAAASAAGRPTRTTTVSFSADGGFRTEAPEATRSRLECLVSPLTGVVQRLERRPFPDGRPLHVYVATHACPAIFESWTDLTGRQRTASAGKGRSRDQARVSALAEAVERVAAVFRGDEPTVSASYRELGGEAVHPNACMLFSDAQYASRDGEDEDGRLALGVPRSPGGLGGGLRPFEEDRPMEWTPVWSVTEQVRKFLPSAFCHLEYPRSRDPGFCRADSNGNAAGNTLEEAVLQGLLELVERDAVALWWYHRARRPAVLGGAAEIEYRRRLEDYLAALGYRLVLLDLTADLEIPVVAALARPLDAAGGRLLSGFGAHLAAEIAVGRALAELCQFLPWGGEDDRRIPRSPHPDVDGAGWDWLEPSADPAGPPLADARLAGLRDLEEIVEGCVELLRGRGLELLVLDQSRRDLVLETVKVVVPGLRPWWPRFAPGRLYDVPLELGWHDGGRRRETDMNPLPLLRLPERSRR